MHSLCVCVCVCVSCVSCLFLEFIVMQTATSVQSCLKGAGMSLAVNISVRVGWGFQLIVLVFGSLRHVHKLVLCGFSWEI